MRMAEYRCTECGTSVEAERPLAQRRSCVGDRCCVPVERGEKCKREEKER
jgi:hypothetical protein